MTREADHVFVLMTSEHRVSRNTRANWYFHHLNSDIRFVPNRKLEELSEEIEIVSVVPKYTEDAIHFLDAKDEVYHISPNTKVTFLARRYRFIFLLDLSPSVATVDIQSNSVLYEEIFVTLSRSLRALCSPAYVPGSNFLFVPEVCLTVLAHTPFYTSEGQQVIVQGWKINSENIENLLATIYRRLKEVTISVAEVTACAGEPKEALQNNSSCSTYWLNGEVDKRIKSQSQVGSTSPDVSIVSMFRYALLALHLLPEPSSTGVVVITDGMLCLPNASVLENLLTQLRNNTIACSFLQIGSAPHPYSCLGYVPNTKLMKFLATATFGVYLPLCPRICEDSLEKMDFNLYHQAFLSWNFQRGLSNFNVENSALNLRKDSWSIRNPYFYSTHDTEAGTLQAGFVPNDQQLIRHKQLEGKVFTKFTNLLSCRLREGFTIKKVTFGKAEKITVTLVLPFQYNCSFEYILSATWSLAASQPLNPDLAENTECFYELFVEAHYTYLHDVTCNIKRAVRQSPYRKDAVRRFYGFHSSLTESDKELVHLNSFTQQTSSNVPEGILSGVPLFYLPPHSSVPTLTSKSSAHQHFAQYWFKVCLLDVRLWQRWMHIRRIDLILELDTPLPKHLHIPDNSGRFHVVSCRQAVKEVNVLLKEYSSFVMLENSSYIKFINNPYSDAPESFFVIRVITRLPYMEIYLAFVGGTSGALTNQIVVDLKSKLGSCKFVKRTSKHKRYAHSENEIKTSEQDWVKINACVLLVKPVEKILIRYNNKPANFLCAFDKHVTEEPQRPSPEQNNLLNTLSRYLHHRRWVWIAQSSPTNKFETCVLARIFSTLLKVRFQEGFHIAYNYNGIINVVQEILMEGDCQEETPCVVQYVIFPPHTNTLVHDNFSEDGRAETETTEADGELQLITECWIEPQVGKSYNCRGKSIYLNSLGFKEIAQAFYSIDLNIISTILTFEHIQLLCENIDLAPFTIPDIPCDSCDERPQNGTSNTYNSPIHTPEEIFARKEANVTVVPFCFDIVKLVAKSQQSFLTFSTLVESINFSRLDASATDKSNAKLMDLIIMQLSQIHDREIEMSPRDNLHFVKYIRERCNGNSTCFPFYPESSPTVEENCAKWKCFAKVMPCSNIVISFIPASFRDLIVLLTSSFTHPIPEDFVEYFSTTDESIGIEMGQSRRCSLSLPLFIYKCNLSDATSTFFSEDSHTKNDIYIDNRLGKDAKRVESIPCSTSDLSNEPLSLSNLEPSHLKKTALKMICKVIEGIVWSSLAMVVFQNLQKSVIVDKRDINFVVTYICNESRVNIDIWPFLRCICKHVREYCVQADSEILKKLEAEKSDEQETHVVSAKSKSFAPSDILNNSNLCCDSRNIHEVIKRRFMEIVLLYFAQVDTDSPYYVLKAPPSAVSNERQAPEKIAAIEARSLIMSKALSNSTPNITDLLSEACIAISHQKNTYDRTHLESTSLPCSLSSRDCSFSSGGGSDDSLGSKSMEHQHENDDICSVRSQGSASVTANVPLFLELQCITQSGKTKGVCTVEKLPTCLADILPAFKQLSTGIDFSCMNVTLSVRFLTCNSYSLTPRFQTLPNVFGSESSDQPDCTSITDNVHLPLPDSQKEIINLFICKLKWMLQDEIVASFLKGYPITEEVLNLVTNHIENSDDSKNCFKEDIPLKFVFEPQESLKRFMEIFCQINISGYHMKKEAKYFYLIFDKESSVNTAQSPFDSNRIRPFSFLDTTATFQSADNMELTKICTADSSLVKSSISDGTTGLDETFGICQTKTPRSNAVISTNCSFSALKSMKISGKRHDSYRNEETDESEAEDVALSLKRRPHRKVSLRQKEKTSSESRSASVPPSSPADKNEESNKPGQSAPTNVFNYLPNPVMNFVTNEDGAMEEKRSRSTLKEVIESSGSTPVAVANFSREDISSVIEDPGYEGDSSNSDCELNWQVNDSENPFLPPFWIILRVTAQSVQLYFHIRKGEDGTDAMQLVKQIKELMCRNCKIVNQTALLKNLHDCRMCSNLLVPNDENVKPTVDQKVFRTQLLVNEPDNIETSYALEIGKEFPPGYFQCDEVWQYHFPLHPRIASAQSRTNISFGMQAMKNVLSAFSVNNRKNMFVYQEPTGKVFYMKLSETACNGSCRDTESFHNMSKSPSFSSINELRFNTENSAEDSTGCFRERIDSNTSEKDRSAFQETMSMTSQTSSLWDRNLTSKGAETRVCIVLHAYGIGDVGKDIKDEMTGLLQKRLDEAVLDLLIVALARNPHCKLTPKDVSFIQKPNQPPTLTTKFVIKPQMWQYLHPVKVYLRQNLLTFLHSPKYTEPVHRFKSCSNDENTDEDDVFLYYRQQASGTSGSKGIACIVVSIVDSADNVVRSISSPPVVVNTDHSLPNKPDFKDEIHCETFKGDCGKSKTPGPFAILRFQVWCVGKCDLEQLSRKLEDSIRWAYWDVITEYKFLTVPLNDGAESQGTISNSMPTSPLKERRPGTFLSEKEKLVLVNKLKKSDANAKAFFSSVPDVRDTKNSSLSSSPSSPKGSYLLSIDSAKNNIKELEVKFNDEKSTVTNIENFERNAEVYRTTFRSWLQFGAEICHPCVTVEQCKLTSKRNMQLYAKEFSEYMKAFSSNINVVELTEDYQRGKVAFSNVENSNSARSSSDCMLILRNTKLWQVFIGYQEDRKSYLESLFSSKAKSHQRLPPHVCNFRNSTPFEASSGGYPLSAVSHTSLSSYSQLDVKSCITQEEHCYAPFVPRQKICLVFLENKNVTLYMYNWAPESMSTVSAFAKHLASWLNSRTSLLNSFVFQKMGIFRNQPFQRRQITNPVRTQRSGSLFSNQSTPLLTSKIPKHNVGHSSDLIELIVEHHSPLILNRKPKTTNENKKTSFADYCHLFRDVITNDPQENCSWYDIREDHLLRFGIQGKNLRKHELKDLQEVSKLWHPYVSKPQIALMERMMMKIKQLGRLQHFCATPLLFTTQWREKVSLVRDHTLDSVSETGVKGFEEDRSRNSSGSSFKTSDSVTLHTRVTDSTTSHPPVKSMRNSVDESWHFAVCSNYIQEYVQYLQTLGFIAIQLRSQLPSISKSSKVKDETSSASDSANTNIYKRNSNAGSSSYYLYKSLMGGLLVFEVGVVEPYVYSYLYSLEGKRIQGSPDNRAHSNQFISSFLDEIDKIKMTMHLHSFTYDYHLRTIHSYISGRQLIFKQGYHLISFLEDFMKYYQKAPNYARNHIHAGVITMSKLSVNPDQLYNYITSHNDRYGMSVFRMVSSLLGETGSDTTTEYVLVELSSQCASYRDHLDSRQLDNFNFGLLICQDAAAEHDKCTLSLKYFLLLTSQRELYPKVSHYTYGSNLGSFKPIRLGVSQPPSRAISRKNSFTAEQMSDATSDSIYSQSTKETSLALSSSAESTLPKVPVKKLSNTAKPTKSGMCDEEVCYLGYFSSHETMMLQILKDKAEAAYGHLREILERAAVHCRRDVLWHALVLDKGILTFNQFTELLSLVNVKPISEFDSGLSPFMVMHISFYQSLAKTLNNKYQQNHKQFTSPDNRIIKHIYMRKAIDGFMLLSINGETNTAEVSLVVKDEPENHTSEYYAQYSLLVEDFINGCAFHLWSSLSN